MLRDNQRRFLIMFVIGLLLLSNVLLFGLWQIEHENAKTILHNAAVQCGYDTKPVIQDDFNLNNILNDNLEHAYEVTESVTWVG